MTSLLKKQSGVSCRLQGSWSAGVAQHGPPSPAPGEGHWGPLPVEGAGDRGAVPGELCTLPSPQGPVHAKNRWKAVHTGPDRTGHAGPGTETGARPRPARGAGRAGLAVDPPVTFGVCLSGGERPAAPGSSSHVQSQAGQPSQLSGRPGPSQSVPTRTAEIHEETVFWGAGEEVRGQVKFPKQPIKTKKLGLGFRRESSQRLCLEAES